MLTTSGSTPTSTDPITSSDLSALLSDRTQVVDEKSLARSLGRTRPPAPSPSPGLENHTAAAGRQPWIPTPVAGLTQAQMNNAKTVVDVGQSLGLPRRALIIGVATAMQESNLYNTASRAVPESFNHPHEGSSSDHDSVGLFQQRPSQGWGSVADLMKPAYQANKFFTKLMQIDWQNMSLTAAAQAVQISAYPNAYAKHEPRATTIVDALLV